MLNDPINTLPVHVQREIELIWKRDVTGGQDRYRKSKDRSGLEGQKRISALLKQEKVSPDWDGRYEAIIEYGRSLYYGKEPPAPKTGRFGKDSWQVGAGGGELESARPDGEVAAPEEVTAVCPGGPPAEGPAYTRSRSFRARVEAHQRRHRARVLGCGHGKYGHLLDEASAADGRNFIRRETLDAVRERHARGKGVDLGRTTGNMLSSQALCFNLFAPLAGDPCGLDLATRVLRPWVENLEAVEEIELEHTPAPDILGDQHGLAGVDCDVLIRYRLQDGARGVMVVETKYVEPSFSRCGYHKPGHRDPCPEDVVLGEDCSGCRYTSKRGFLYWARSLEHGTLDMDRVRQTGCPFAGPLWQLWVNHTLAHALAARSGAGAAMMGVVAPADSDTLLRGGEILDRFRSYLSAPDSLVFLPLEALLERLVEEAADTGADWSAWAEKLQERYTTEGEPQTACDGYLTHPRVRNPPS